MNEPAVKPDAKAAAIIPRYHLPDEWSGKGACPVCRTPGRLGVQRQDALPDRMVCGVCGTAFEVESAGARIRLATAPPGLAASAATVLEAWLTPAELLILVERGAAPVANSPVEAPAGPLGARAPQLAPSADLTRAVSNVSLASSTSLIAKPTKSAETEPELEPGTEDWFASLAAAIGGAAPVKPLPDAVLADELERALLNRPEFDSSDTAGLARAENGGAPRDGPAVTAAPGSAMAVTPAAPEMAEPKRAEVVLAGTIAALAAANSPVAAPTAAQAAVTPLSEPASAPVDGSSAPEPAATGPVIVSGGPAPARRELAERAWKLHELGNTLPAIQSALETSAGAPEDVSAIMAKLAALEQARQARFRRTVQWAAGAALVGLLLLIVLAFSVSNLSAPAPVPVTRIAAGVGSPGPGSTSPVRSGTPAPGQAEATATLAYNPFIALINQVLPGDVKIANGASPTPGPSALGDLFPAAATLSANDQATGEAKKSNLPGWLATLVPNGMTVITGPTPSLEANGPPKSVCPATAAQAAALFGGPADSWSYSRQQQGWIFILADNPTSIRIPANMAAGYLVIGNSLTMLSAVGPVTIHNVNFVAVSCE